MERDVTAESTPAVWCDCCRLVSGCQGCSFQKTGRRAVKVCSLWNSPVRTDDAFGYPTRLLSFSGIYPLIFKAFTILLQLILLRGFSSRISPLNAGPERWMVLLRGSAFRILSRSRTGSTTSLSSTYYRPLPLADIQGSISPVLFPLYLDQEGGLTLFSIVSTMDFYLWVARRRMWNLEAIQPMNSWWQWTLCGNFP